MAGPAQAAGRWLPRGPSPWVGLQNNRIQMLLSPTKDLEGQTVSKTCQSKGLDVIELSTQHKDIHGTESGILNVNIWTEQPGRSAVTRWRSRHQGRRQEKRMDTQQWRVKEGAAPEDGGRWVWQGDPGRKEGGCAPGLADVAQTLSSSSKTRRGAQQREPTQKWGAGKKIRFRAVLLVNLKIKQWN